MDNQQLNRTRFNKLKAQRLLEIKREGVFVYYFYGSMGERSFFEFSPIDFKKASDLISQSKFMLELCTEAGQIIMKFQSEQLYFDPQQHGKLLISDKKVFRNLQDRDSYYLVKRNPTNAVYKSIYSLDGEVYQKNEHSFSECIKDYIQETIPSIAVKQIITFDQQPDMNQQQNIAISKVGQNALTFIKGPPGCGKTRTIGRLCRLLLEKQKKVIVGTVSNTGNISILRQILKQIEIYNNHEVITHLMYELQNYTQDIEQTLLCNEHVAPLKLLYFTPLQSREQNQQLQPLIRYYSLNQYLIRNILHVNAHHDLSVREIEWNINCIVNKQTISNKFYSIYMQAFAKTIHEAHIIVSTTVISASINQKREREDFFCPDVAILDEAAQASWADTFCYLKFDVSRLVLVGDENQLDPTVISQDKLLKETVFGKLSKKRKEYFVMLDTQYRMHPEISQFPNRYFYNNELKNGVTAQEMKSEITHFRDYPISFVTHTFYQNQYVETDHLSKGKKNYYNHGQIRIIQHLLSYFPKEQLKNVGIITPYSLQLKAIAQIFIRDILQYGLTVKTCDGYQGGEKDYIIVSCVRSNFEGKIGFCGEKNRTNVTLTRARKGLAIIGNMQTLSSGIQYEQGQNVWASLIQDLKYKNKIINYGGAVQTQPTDGPTVTMNQIDKHKQGQNKPSPKGELSSKQLSQKLQKQQPLIVDDEEDDQIQKLNKKNKKQAKQIRRLTPFGGTDSPKFDANDCLQKIVKIFADISPDTASICKRMTKSVFKQLVTSLEKTEKIDPINELLQLLKCLDPAVYENNHLKQASNIYTITRLILFHKAIESCL